MDYEKLNLLSNNLREFLNEIENYNQEYEILRTEYETRFDEFTSIDLQKNLTKISNCEAQIEFNKTQFRQTIKQINELI